MPVVLSRNIGLDTRRVGGGTSTVGEPNVANKGRRIFFSGNWFATKSLDQGRTWDPVSPYSTLPPANGGFCCDQSLIFERSRDLLVWILQYREQSGTNTLRVAINPGATLADSDWYWWDFQPVGVNSSWSGEWFDYNHVATSSNYLYVGTNVFTAATDEFTRSVVFRFPLDALAGATPLTYSYFSTTDNFSLRCVQGAKDVMYFGSHNNTRQLRLFSWPESSPSVSWRDINVTPWSRKRPYEAKGPDNRNWLGRCDPRITGAAIANGKIFFAWTANKSRARPFPHIKVATIDENTGQLIDEPDIWNRDYAFAYPALSPNRRGIIGITLFRGGGNHNPGHLVGVRDDALGSWVLRTTRDSTDGPTDGKWGDYLGIVPYSETGYSWFASGFTLRGGGQREHIEPRVVQFYYR